MSEDKKATAEMKLSLSEEKNLGFLIAMSKTNTEKITKEILEGLSEDTDDSDNYDVDSGGEDSEDRPWRPSHAVFGKSSIKENHLVNMRGRYFWDLSVVRADEGEKTCPNPESWTTISPEQLCRRGAENIQRLSSPTYPRSNHKAEYLRVGREKPRSGT
jgi:hypothetical protein